ncbi:TetR/AcrR family transcriptional regulator [Wenzhouxiangella sp. XN79A]|uniref:TetR/AcrR family transcriptional regulator n=1 Tax=Wenzhouxiangella sp. XN79A TaxID=2724193 RepID=UPI00144A7FBC|nr:TetR/AcrR family transcriptional regulator [Wenzhouxiangella sp. XN79A]NKI35204.1 TetR/AcrR family transcriptional regulator [Wenzhouxiangella sp. XN79A]
MSKNVQRNVGRPVDPDKDRDILAAGRALLFGAGPEAVTMEAVAREAGVAKPTLYRRYANRDELIAAVATAEAERMAGRFRLVPGSADDLKQALVEFGCDLTGFLLSAEHLNYVQALGASAQVPQSTRDSIYRHGPRGTQARLADWLARAADRDLLDCPDADYSAEQFLGMLMGLDLVRTLYRVPLLRDADALHTRVRRLVSDFLRLHAAS